MVKIQPGQFINLYCNQGQRLLLDQYHQVDEKRMPDCLWVVGKGIGICSISIAG